MMKRIKSKLMMYSIGLVALLAAVGGGGIVAARAYVSTAPSQPRSSATTQAQLSTGQQENLSIEGTIKSIDNTALTFVLLPDGKTQAITISFDHATNIEQGQGQLSSGSHVLVEIVQRPDGVLYATEIKPVSQVNQGQNANNDKDGGHDENNDHGEHGDSGGGHGHDQGEAD